MLLDTRSFQYKKKRDEEKYVLYTRKSASSEQVELINPNKWGENDSLAFAVPSPNGKLVAFGKDIAGRENPTLRILDVERGQLLEDALPGWRQYFCSWLKDGSGFFYKRCPLKGKVPDGDEYYWNSVHFHRIGTPASEDNDMFPNDKTKEHQYSASVSEDGKYVIFTWTESTYAMSHFLV